MVQNVWWYTKRPTNVVLVVDTSGSMEDGNKMEATQQALQAFLDNIRGDRDQVALIEFGTEIKRVEPLQPLTDEGRDLPGEGHPAPAAPGQHRDARRRLGGPPADPATQDDREAINAIVVMSDGLENASSHVPTTNCGAPSRTTSRGSIVVFTIGFGDNADVKLLQEVALIGGGQFRSADETDIEELYRIISTYF